MLTIYAIETSEIYGHGTRLVVWFSGCTLRCTGCINQYLWDKSAGQEVSVAELFKLIKKYKGIDGVTYIGGEPLQQGIELSILSKKVVDIGLDIVLFTGYELSELNQEQQNVVDMATVTITGRYDSTKRDTGLLLRGSSNQKIEVREEKLNEYYSNEFKQIEIEISETENKYLGFPEDLF